MHKTSHDFDSRCRHAFASTSHSNTHDERLSPRTMSRCRRIDFASTSTSHSLVSRRARLDELSVSTSLSTSAQLRLSASRSISMRAITTVNDEIGPLTRRARLREFAHRLRLRYRRVRLRSRTASLSTSFSPPLSRRRASPISASRGRTSPAAFACRSCGANA